VEGVGGVNDATEQLLPGQRRFSEWQRPLTGEVNAAVEGVLAAGASEIVIWDGQDGSRTLAADEIHGKAKLIQGRPTPANYYLSDWLTMESSSWGSTRWLERKAACWRIPKALPSSESPSTARRWRNRESGRDCRSFSDSGDHAGRRSGRLRGTGTSATEGRDRGGKTAGRQGLVTKPFP
jgi:hypothetical protein